MSFLLSKFPDILKLNKGLNSDIKAYVDDISKNKKNYSEEKYKAVLEKMAKDICGC